MIQITDGVLEADEPELELPGPRSLPVEVVNFTEPIKAQAITTHGVNVPYATSVQLLNADPLRKQAQITCYGDGELWLCHSKAAADSIASFLGSQQGVSQLNTIIPGGQGANTFSYTLLNPLRLQAVTYNYVAGATVSNRFPTFQIFDNAGNLVSQAGAGGPVVASTTQSAVFAEGIASHQAAQFSAYEPLPNLPELPAGWILKILNPGGAVAGDVINAVVFTVMEGANAGPVFDEVDGVPITQNSGPMPVGATAGLWGVATGDNMFAGVLTERGQQ